MFHGLVWIDCEFEFFGELSDLRGGAFQIESKRAARFGAEHDVLSHCHGLDQHEVLVDHTDSQRDRIVRRLDIAHLAIDNNLAAVSRVKAVRDPHRRGLPGAVLSYDRVNGPRLDDDVYVIVSQHIAEALCYLSEFEHSEVLVSRKEAQKAQNDLNKSFAPFVPFCGNLHT